MHLLRQSLLAACLFPIAATAAIPPPLPADIHRELVRFRADTGDVAQGTAGLLRALLESPSSPYSEPTAEPYLVNEIWWDDFVPQVDHGRGTEAVVNTLRWQLGLTKARPGKEIEVSPEQSIAFRGAEAAANAIKAGIDPDLFAKAWDMNPTHVTVAAHDAVALQIVREQMAAAPREAWPSLAIDPAVIDRYMRARNGGEILADDADYLSSVVSAAIQSGTSSTGADGTLQLPAAFRVARVAAAYKDALGYFGAEPYCIGGEPSPRLATGPGALDDNRPLCFVGATDRGVLAWYREESRLDLSGARIHENTKEGWSRALTILGIITPIMDLAAFVEFAEAAASEQALDLEGSAGSAASEASQRLSRLMCEVRA